MYFISSLYGKHEVKVLDNFAYISRVKKKDIIKQAGRPINKQTLKVSYWMLLLI